MKIKRISIYHEFHCTGSDCPVNCCKGWQIPVDKNTCQKFLQEKGLFGILLRCSIVHKNDITAFRSVLGKCPFLGIDKLCTIQKKHGTAYMPLVCIQFPRQLYNLDFFCEETLYLACPEAARLFLSYAQQGKPFDFTEIQGTVDYPVNTTNDDEQFLYHLIEDRAQLIQLLHEGIPYDSMEILLYGQQAQNACLHQSSLPRPIEVVKHHSATMSKSFSGVEQTDKQNRFFMDFTVLDTLFFNGFYHPSLQTTLPFLYKLCRRYLREFGTFSRFSSKTANQKLILLQEHLFDLVPDLGIILNRYYEYYLLTNFLDIFEDYSFSKHLLFGIAKTNMLCLFFALYAKHKKSLSVEELSKIMAVYERRAPQLEDALKLLSIPSCDLIEH